MLAQIAVSGYGELNQDEQSRHAFAGIFLTFRFDGFDRFDLSSDCSTVGPQGVGIFEACPRSSTRTRAPWVAPSGNMEEVAAPAGGLGGACPAAHSTDQPAARHNKQVISKRRFMFPLPSRSDLALLALTFLSPLARETDCRFNPGFPVKGDDLAV